MLMCSLNLKMQTKALLLMQSFYGLLHPFSKSFWKIKLPAIIILNNSRNFLNFIELVVVIKILQENN